MRLFILFTVCCFGLLTQGSPVGRRAPCLERQMQVNDEINTYNSVLEEPRYLPVCDTDGVTWKLAQCSHQDIGYCFCVDPDTGLPREGTTSYTLSRESLRCAPTDEPKEDKTLCQQEQEAYELYVQQFLTMENPLQYYPECGEDNNFLAMQRNDRTFFCVDTEIGAIIPGTDMFGAAYGKPVLSENICQMFSDIRKEYLSLLQTSSNRTPMPQWSFFLEENANNVLRRFLEGETTDFEHLPREPPVIDNEQAEFIPEEFEEVDPRQQVETYEPEEQEEPEEGTQPPVQNVDQPTEYFYYESDPELFLEGIPLNNQEGQDPNIHEFDVAEVEMPVQSSVDQNTLQDDSNFHADLPPDPSYSYGARPVAPPAGVNTGSSDSDSEDVFNFPDSPFN